MQHAKHDNPALSFMTASDEHPTAAPAETESEKTMPLGVGDVMHDASLDPLVSAAGSKKFKAGSFVLVVVVVMACAGLWFMKTLSKVSASSIGDREIEASIDKFITGMKGNDKKSNSSALGSGDASVLAVLSGSYVEKQIPLDGVQRDPFILFGEDMGSAMPMGDDSSSAVARRRGEIERAATQLELKSVLMGTQPLANIGGKIVRTGEEIVLQPDNITFRVIEITKESVSVAGEDPRLNLSVPFTIFLKR